MSLLVETQKNLFENYYRNVKRIVAKRFYEQKPDGKYKDYKTNYDFNLWLAAVRTNSEGKTHGS